MTDARPGHALARTMGVVGSLLITLSALSPSIGVFVVGADVVHEAGSAAFACFAAAALLGVAIGAVYAELASAFPETGGEYTIVGRVLGPTWGFCVLGLNLLTFSIAPAMTALGVSAYLAAVAPGLPAVGTAVVLVVLCTAVSILNVRLNALVTGLFLAVELLALGTIAWLGFGHGRAHALAPAILHPVMLAGGGRLAPASFAAMGLGAAAAIYAFDGYGSVVYLGEEIRDASRRVAAVVFLALGLAAAFMLGPILAVLAGVRDLAGLMGAPSPLLAFTRSAGGPALARVMSVGVALALFNAMIASALMGGRQLYSSGRDQAWPPRLNRAFAALHPRFNSPWIATLAVGATSVLWCLLKLQTLVILIGDGTAAIYVCMCLAALRGRRPGAALASAWRMPLFPLLPGLALLALGAVAAADLLDAEGRAGLLASAVTVVLAAAYYWAVVRRRGTWAHRGPTP